MTVTCVAAATAGFPNSSKKFIKNTKRKSTEES
jgi:hypothetical protein